MSDTEQKGLLKKLDRVLGNLSLLASFPSVHASFLPYGLSDHCPAVVNIDVHSSSKSSLHAKPFKFNNHLSDSPNFLPLVNNAWSRYVGGCHMFYVVSKLKDVKKGLRKLNMEHGNVFENVKNLRVELNIAQTCMDAEPENGEVHLDRAVYLKLLKDALVAEEKFLRQRSKIHWLKEGDSNTAYFHNVVKSKVNKGRINEVEDLEGNRYVGPDVAEQFVKHFQSILGTEDSVKSIEDPSSLFQKRLSTI
ncbi:uncharacterized protein LOC112504542 [Cynara cardunculus var. scolymus]|uniref:uncharacterized protein LOC112504542 n=1 Tax=Cynara cardunculus var. scolymus TaxID=59895 RepID=UPI000D62F661|nr:uncharacterized protein LOC112504542 [Cynara cardunculus var. scolymus]